MERQCERQEVGIWNGDKPNSMKVSYKAKKQ